MKKAISILGTLTVFTWMAFVGGKSPVDVYQVDTRNSSLEWFGEKIAGVRNGTIQLSRGEIKNDNGNITGTFEIDMTTIENKDATGETKATIENDLKSAEFFDVARFPKSTFIMTSATAIADAQEGGFTHTVKGNLTIMDNTNEITCDAVIKMETEKITCVGTAVVDRTKFGVMSRSKTLTPDIGEKLIYDEFKVKFSVIAIK